MIAPSTPTIPPVRSALAALAGCAAILAAVALGPGAARAADPLVIEGDGSVRVGAASGGIVVTPGGAVHLGAAAAPPLTVDGTSVKVGTTLSFGRRQGAMLTLWEPGVNIGVQSWTMYFRSYGNFAWFARGSHADDALAPGSGGTTLMSLVATPPAGRGMLDVGGSVSARSLDIAGSAAAASLRVAAGASAASLDVSTVARTGTEHPKVAPSLYVTGNFPEGPPADGAAPGVEFRHTNGTQGIGFGYNTIYATGTIRDQPLRLQGRGASGVEIRGNLSVSGALALGSGWTMSAAGNSLSINREGRAIMVINDGERLQYNVPNRGVHFLGWRDDAFGSHLAVWESDSRLKSEVAAIPLALDRVRALRGVTFRWNALARDRDASVAADRQVGVIAQEVEAVLPEAVRTAADGYKSVQYRDLIPLLIEALKEQDRTVAAQAERIGTLEARLAAMEAAAPAGLIAASATAD